MCCNQKGHHGDHCTCGCHSGVGACFWTNQEKVAWLEEHLKGLQAEVKAVEGRIAALKGEHA